jgi:2-keto-4-pentenoate hydratase/2-oxohepta-3-ene-1,7-dioic acid hydratase in catechol pathway
MRFVTYDRNDSPRAGLAVGGVIVDLEKGGKALASVKLPSSVRELLAGGKAMMRKGTGVARKAEALIKKIDKGTERRPTWAIPEDRVHLGPPLPDPEKVICLGLNYREHVAEGKGKFRKTAEDPPNPIIFTKFATTLTGPYDPIRLPPKRVSSQVDYEVELALVIGREARGVKAKDALDYVAGYMVMNDVSARDCQFNDKQWVRAKSFDSFGPCGPWMVSADEIPHPNRLKLWTVLNGERVQDSSTRHQIFKIPFTIAFLSQAMTLRPGDIISTGTPAGVGIFREPQLLLNPGDTVECGIEGIGTICNTCERSK